MFFFKSCRFFSKPTGQALKHQTVLPNFWSKALFITSGASISKPGYPTIPWPWSPRKQSMMASLYGTSLVHRTAGVRAESEGDGEGEKANTRWWLWLHKRTYPLLDHMDISKKAIWNHWASEELMGGGGWEKAWVLALFYFLSSALLSILLGCASQPCGAAAGEAESPVPQHRLPLNLEMAARARTFARHLIRQGCMRSPPRKAGITGRGKWPRPGEQVGQSELGRWISDYGTPH